MLWRRSRSRMRETAILLWFTIGVAVVFDFTNGFHDTANAIATSISTRALSPRAAVALSAVFNLIGAVITVAFFQAKVSNTIASTLAIKPGLVVVMAALFGAIAWNLITWYRGLPSSSTHALIGGLCGAGIAAAGGLGDLRRWVANHKDNGLEHPQARARDGFVSATHGGDCDSSRHACRPPCQHDACDHGGRYRRRRQPKTVSSPLGSRRQHHRRVVRDD